MLFCPPENKINTPPVLNVAGMWFKAGYHSQTWKVPPSLLCECIFPAELHKWWWRGGCRRRRCSLLTAIGFGTDAPKLLFHIDHLTCGGIRSLHLGRGRAVLSCKCTARPALPRWRWINKQDDEHGSARCHSLAHLSPRSGDDWRQPPPADESPLQAGWS